MDKATDPHNGQNHAPIAPSDEAPPPAPIRSRFADDPEMQDLLLQFTADMPSRATALEASWEKRDLDRVMRICHQLKGAGSGYGFPELSSAAGHLEASLRCILDEGATMSPPRLRSEFGRLLSVCRSVRAA